HATDVTDQVGRGPFPGSMMLSVIDLTVYPAGDEDWYVAHAVALTSFNSPGPGVHMAIYRDGELVANDPQFGFFNQVPGPHEWEFHFSAKDRPVAYTFGT